MPNSHEHRHPENYSFTFKCLAALTVTAAVVAQPLLIIPVLIAAFLYALYSMNEHHSQTYPKMREQDNLPGILSFFNAIRFFTTTNEPCSHHHVSNHYHRQSNQHNHPQTYQNTHVEDDLDVILSFFNSIGFFYDPSESYSTHHVSNQDHHNHHNDHIHGHNHGHNSSDDVYSSTNHHNHH
jgi:hypothetical protein